jgi:hypothetical protein
MSDQRTCSNCGTPMQASQGWCLQCGAGAPDRLRPGPGWRSATLAIGGAAVLALGAAAAAYAALAQHPPPKPKAPVVAQKPAAPTTGTPLPSTPSPTPGSVPPSNTGVPPVESQPETLKTPPARLPKIPSPTPTPTGKRADGQGGKPTSKANEKATKPGGKGNESSSTEPGGESRKSAEGRESTRKQNSQSVPILLDPNAAQVYDPNDLPVSRFGDPSLAIDGEATTAWTVQLEPAEAPQVDAGVSLDLKAALGIAKLTLITETPGITVQVYGTSARKLPQTLTSEEWVRLSRAHLIKQRKGTIELSESRHRFRQLLIWVVNAPTSSSGQFTAAEVKVNELQVYEATRQR